MAAAALACGVGIDPPPDEVTAAEEAAQEEASPADESLLLEEVAESACGAVETPPPSITEGSTFLLQCVFAAGHATSVRIERFDSAQAAQAAFESDTAGIAQQNFHGQPAAAWAEPFPSAGPDAANRFFQWQSGRWVVLVNSFDDTAFRIAPDPAEVAETIHEFMVAMDFTDD